MAVVESESRIGGLIQLLLVLSVLIRIPVA